MATVEQMYSSSLTVSPEIEREVIRFLYFEAALLDDRRYDDWLNLLTDDVVYRMPQRITLERKDGYNIIDDTAFYEEDIKSLQLRVERLRMKSAWNEDPPTRNRRLITNIMVEPGTNETEVFVNSHFLLLRTRADDTTNYQIFGERFDRLRKVGNEWKICSRVIHPDQTVLSVLNLTFL
jgi:3-phenylpropionate/cinnamic acid dioxygenase small subunit